jgi:tRNA U55 pseudouridine synthase TruB
MVESVRIRESTNCSTHYHYNRNLNESVVIKWHNALCFLGTLCESIGRAYKPTAHLNHLSRERSAPITLKEVQ